MSLRISYSDEHPQQPIWFLLLTYPSDDDCVKNTALLDLCSSLNTGAKISTLRTEYTPIQHHIIVEVQGSLLVDNKNKLRIDRKFLTLEDAIKHVKGAVVSEFGFDDLKIANMKGEVKRMLRWVRQGKGCLDRKDKRKGI
ncbi:hypothetical protein N0V90_009942 [Kalmusia sp. IMI 367209]|nr:hypothetical protein N0V90_009942 [Kalmusia sp. IMI 367209]